LLLLLSRLLAGTRVPLADGHLVPPAGIAVEANGTRVTFRKASEERRFLGFESGVAGLATVKALEALYSLDIRGGTARLALLTRSATGERWFKVDNRPLPTGDDREARLALKSLAEAEFSRDDGKPFAWEEVERVCFGIVIDGKAEGSFELHAAALTDEPYRPTRPLVVPFADGKLWTLSHDGEAKLALAVENGAVRADFIFPGGRHMYAVPSVRLREAELSGYSGLRIEYRAALPKGIDGLLVMLIERQGGTQYVAAPAPPASAEWRTATLPFTSFQRGGWSKDDDDRLDLDGIESVAIGAHGTTQETLGKGVIQVRAMAFVP